VEALETATGKLEQEWVSMKVTLPSGDVIEHREGMWPKQKQFYQARARYVLFGGARGPGKTRALAVKILRQALRWPGIPIYLLRRDLKDLKRTTEVEWQRVCPPQLYDPRYGGQHHKGENWYRLVNGSIIYLGEGKDSESYKSVTAGMFVLDEANEFEEDFFLNIDPAMRWTTGEGLCTYPECEELGEEYAREHSIHPFYQIAMATNPSPGWLKTRFWDTWKAGRERKNYKFIPATAYDNPSLPPDFIPRLLENNTATWVRNFIDGDWSSFENMVWPTFNRGVHVWKGNTPFDEFTRIEGGIDYGGTTEHSHRTCAYLTGFTKTGKTVTFWEYSKQGGASNDLFEQIAMATKMFHVYRWWADASQPRSNQQLRLAGINVVDAPRYKGAVKEGINQINRLLALSPAGEPQLYVTESCPRLLSGIETYQLDPQTGEPAKNQEDDEVDAWRYNIMGLLLAGVAGRQPLNREYKVKNGSGGVDSKPSRMLQRFREERRNRLREDLRRMETHG